MAGAQPIVSGMAGRYATALIELLEAAKQRYVKGDLDRFDVTIATAPTLRLVRSPAFSDDKALYGVGQGRIAGWRRILKFITSNRRLFAVRDMIRAYHALVARHHGEVTAQVTVAEPLNEAHRAAIMDALKSVTGKENVGLDVKVDPAIIGGLVVKLGSRMVDSSLRTKLNSIKHAMKEVG